MSSEPPADGGGDDDAARAEAKRKRAEHRRKRKRAAARNAGRDSSEEETASSTRTATQLVALDGDGVVRCVVLAGADIGRDEAVENVAATRSVAGGQRAPVLFDARHLRSMSREAREYYASRESKRVHRAVAILIDSPLSRVLAKLFVRLNDPPFPTEMFADEKEALRWLRKRL